MVYLNKEQINIIKSYMNEHNERPGTGFKSYEFFETIAKNMLIENPEDRQPWYKITDQLSTSNTKTTDVRIDLNIMGIEDYTKVRKMDEIEIREQKPIAFVSEKELNLLKPKGLFDLSMVNRKQPDNSNSSRGTYETK